MLLNIDHEVLWFIKKASYSLKDILPKGKKLFLRAKANVSAGGDLEDATLELPENIKTLAVKSIKAIPGLKNGGVDVLFCEDKNKEGVILEVNSMGIIVGHLFPSIGDSIDAPAELIDYYFPESIINKTKNKNLFFNMHVVECFSQNCPEAEYTLPPVPDKDISFRQLILQGGFDSPRYKIWLRNHARRLNLSGFAKDINDKTIKVVIAGSKTDISLFCEICEKYQQGAKNQKIKCLDYPAPTVWGFYIV